MAKNIKNNGRRMLSFDDLPRVSFLKPNVASNERLLSVLSGLLFLMIGNTRRSLAGSSMMLGGAYLLFRGVTGHCPGYRMLGIDRLRQAINTGDEPPPPSVEDSDEVTEASWESFPTSDAPSFAMGKREGRE